MQGNNSPEEKLLNLIKQGKTGPKNNGSAEPPKPKPAPVSKVVFKKKKSGFRSLLLVNRILLVVVVSALIYLVLSFIFPYRSATKIPARVSLKEEMDRETEEQKKSPITHYTNVLSRRQMFKMYELPRPKTKEPAKPRVTLQQLLGGYTFVGIIFGDNPQAIVEQKKTGQSYYLVAGQFLGEIKIEKIEKGKITVSYGEEVLAINI